MDVPIQKDAEPLSEGEGASSDNITTFESLDALGLNLDRGRASFVSYASSNSRGNTLETNDRHERLYQATDIVLIVFGIIVFVSLIISLVLFIFGQSRIYRGLDSYVHSFED